MSLVKRPNRLIAENSPYLLQHAYNPVDWYPWGEKALRRAVDEDRPILLSIGYSSCHWCHVMERESFEDAQTAKLMNENLVCIKVDREERPDLDSIYMNAIQAMTGSGGWPMTVFLTPDGKPFYGGTYFPPEPRHGLPSFKQIILGVANAYKKNRAGIEDTATDLQKRLQTNLQPKSNGSLESTTLEFAFVTLNDAFDDTYGGFGGAPKFPQPVVFQFLLRFYVKKGYTTALTMVEKTLTNMAGGGIYDQLGGGFHRYSVDARWLVPHFEKMLYDNALLSRLYLNAYQVTGKSLYCQVVEETLDYVVREMTNHSGGFYSAQDADSEGEEGMFYLWTLDEVKSVLGHQDGNAFTKHFDVTEGGNFEEKNILNVKGDAGPSRVNLDDWRKRLLKDRERRIKPATDNKILTGWNGLMMASFAEAGRILNRPDYIGVAEKNAHFILDQLLQDNRLLRSWNAGKAKVEGYLEDYSFYADALLALYQATFNPKWFVEAKKLVDIIHEQFFDDKGNFYDTGDHHEKLIIRPKILEDNAIPSGGSMATKVLLTLATYTGEKKYRTAAEKALQKITGFMERYPNGFGNWLSALDFYLTPTKEVAIIGDVGGEDTRSLLKVALGTYRPNMILAVGHSGQTGEIPLLSNKTQINGLATAYVCNNFTCKKPTTDSNELAKILV